MRSHSDKPRHQVQAERHAARQEMHAAFDRIVTNSISCGSDQPDKLSALLITRRRCQVWPTAWRSRFAIRAVDDAIGMLDLGKLLVQESIGPAFPVRHDTVLIMHEQQLMACARNAQLPYLRACRCRTQHAFFLVAWRRLVKPRSPQESLWQPRLAGCHLGQQ